MKTSEEPNPTADGTRQYWIVPRDSDATDPESLDAYLARCGDGYQARNIEEVCDAPITREHLQQLASVMGSGGLIVMDDTDRTIELLRFYLGFCITESCGKCAPCRVGGTQILQVLDRFAKGEAHDEDFDTIKRLAHAMQRASSCGVGQTAPNPILSVMRHFEPEFRSKCVSGPATQTTKQTPRCKI